MAIQEKQLEQQLEHPNVTHPTMITTDLPGGPLDLLTTVSALATRRYDAIETNMRAAKAAKEDQHRAIDERVRKVAEEKAEEFARRHLIEIPAHKNETQQRIAARLRHCRSLRGQSDTELERILDKELNRVRRQGYWYVKGETEAEWYKRYRSMEAWLDELAGELFRRRLMDKLRYVDGYPVNTFAVHPHLMPPKTPERSGLGRCLRCRVKRMRCSLTVSSGYSWDAEPECSRCRLCGDPCIVKPFKLPNVESSWGFADPERWQRKQAVGDDEPEGSVDEKQLIRELMAERERGRGKIPLPAWHENDKQDNLIDWEYEPTRWWHVLNGQPAKWHRTDFELVASTK
ncbi:hypothetical protein BGZ61DRAFT_533527 [Ilyonectria robusta]|uniref:uncharacterized protein n=1 Tax=Ilyonectria robusta TaxID=1079257 RepID=UPI001E8D7996|nr:uncharacterized protein BGZ61DRAFT_533527 [Ilyonectria robusta]KAH8686856.1 hypothetical protein BGZ61DRAFT_533527 [Ilyonectria robusta]